MGASGAVLGAFLIDFGTWAGEQTPFKKQLVFFGFLHFLEARKGCLRHLGGCLGRFRNICEHVGDKMASKRDKMATKRANMATKSVKMSQHERE